MLIASSRYEMLYQHNDIKFLNSDQMYYNMEKKYL